MFTAWHLGTGIKMVKLSPVLYSFSYQITGVPRAGSGPRNRRAGACLASLSASSLPMMPRCPGTHMRVTSLRSASANSASWHSATSLEVTLGPLRALRQTCHDVDMCLIFSCKRISIEFTYNPFMYKTIKFSLQ